jgi:amino acid transporter
LGVTTETRGEAPAPAGAGRPPGGADRGSAAPASRGTIGVAGATAIGVGGMMGAGLYTLVGLATTATGVWLPFAFLVGGCVAFFSVYSYAKLGVRYPSRGGAAQFLVETFGDGVLAGGMNIFQFLGWIVAMALYATGFAGYAQDLLGLNGSSWTGKAIAVGIILAMMLVNFIGPKIVSRAETAIIVFELIILAVFVVAGLMKAEAPHLTFSSGMGPLGILFGAGLLYVTYEGFGVMTNTTGEMSDPRKQLPKAMYAALAIVMVVYLIVSTVIVLVMKVPAIEANAGHVLDEAAEIALGRAGFIAIGVAALVATASAVNATMFGDANLAFQVAKDGQLPKVFERHVWLSGGFGLIITAALTCVFVLAFPLSAVGQMASLAFLIVYGMVSVGHLRVRRDTGAKRWMLVTAVVLNAALFVLLLYYAIVHSPAATWITLLALLVGSFVVEWLYRRRTGRKLQKATPQAADLSSTSGSTAAG